MKPFFLFLITGISIATISFAQPNMLGKTGDYIKAYSYLPNGIGTFEKEGKNSDNTIYLQFSAKSDSSATFRYYLNNKGICTWFVIMQPTTDMAGTIMSLNDTYIKIGDDEWISKAKDLRITLSYRKGDRVFTTGFSKIE